MERLKSFASKAEEARSRQPLIEEFASEVRRMRGRAADMHKASNALRAKMKTEAEERRSKALSEIQDNMDMLTKSAGELREKFNEFIEEFNERVRREMRHIWGTHPPGTRVTDIV